MNKDLVHLQLQCSRNWSDMKPTDSGAFCSTCSTELVDFSNSSLIEINDYLKEHSDKKICGKFTKNQLHPQSPAMFEPLAQFSLRTLVMGAALSTFMSFDVNAGTNVVLGGTIHASEINFRTPHPLLVYESNGETPIAFVKLTLISPEGLELKTLFTSMTGDVIFPALATDKLYRIRVEKDGYLPRTIFISNETWLSKNTVELIKKH